MTTSSILVPNRFRDIEYFPDDKILVTFTFGSGGVPLDVSGSVFTVTATADNHSSIAQPEVDLTEGADGKLHLQWTKQQVATLPRYFTVEIAETSGTNFLADLTWNDLGITVHQDAQEGELDESLWTDLAESLIWDGWGEASIWGDTTYGELTWDDFPDYRWEQSGALWDRTFLIGRFTRNDRGR